MGRKREGGWEGEGRCRRLAVLVVMVREGKSERGVEAGLTNALLILHCGVGFASLLCLAGCLRASALLDEMSGSMSERKRSRPTNGARRFGLPLPLLLLTLLPGA